MFGRLRQQQAHWCGGVINKDAFSSRFVEVSISFWEILIHHLFVTENEKLCFIFLRGGETPFLGQLSVRGPFVSPLIPFEHNVRI